MLRGICIVHIHPRTHVLDHAGYTAPTQHELGHTDHTDHTDQEHIYLPCLTDPDHELVVGIDDLCDACKLL